MNGKKKTIVALSLGAVVLGGLICLGAMASADFDFTALGTVQTSDTVLTVEEPFDHVIVTSGTSDIRILPAEDGAAKVVSRTMERMPVTAEVQSGTLRITERDERRWYEHIGIFFGETYIEVYLPEEDYGTIALQTDTGDVSVPSGSAVVQLNIQTDTGDVTVGALAASEKVVITTDTGDILLEGVTVPQMSHETGTGDITVKDGTVSRSLRLEGDTGRIAVSGVSCGSLYAEGDTGDIRLENTLVSGKLELENNTGDVIIAASDADSVTIETDTGGVKAEFLTPKMVFAKSDTGRVKVPSTRSGGMCEIKSNTGNIDVTIR